MRVSFSTSYRRRDGSVSFLVFGGGGTGEGLTRVHQLQNCAFIFIRQRGGPSQERWQSVSPDREQQHCCHSRRCAQYRHRGALKMEVLKVNDAGDEGATSFLMTVRKRPEAPAKARPGASAPLSWGCKPTGSLYAPGAKKGFVAGQGDRIRKDGKRSQLPNEVLQKRCRTSSLQTTRRKTRRHGTQTILSPKARTVKERERQPHLLLRPRPTKSTRPKKELNGNLDASTRFAVRPSFFSIKDPQRKRKDRSQVTPRLDDRKRALK